MGEMMQDESTMGEAYQAPHSCATQYTLVHGYIHLFFFLVLTSRLGRECVGSLIFYTLVER